MLRHSQGGAREGTELFCKKEAYILDYFWKTILCQVFMYTLVTLYFVHLVVKITIPQQSFVSFGQTVGTRWTSEKLNNRAL